MKSQAEYLQDMLNYIARIEQIAALGETAFYAEFRNQDAIIRQYEVIGEIAKRLPMDLLNKVDYINWSQVKGFRDFLAHNYDHVELEIIWSAVELIPRLRQAVETLLLDLEDE